jgi:prophage tail gpP-like protein
MLEDAKFGLRHCSAIFRMATVGNETWEKAMATLCKPFTKAVVNYCEMAEIDRARAWLHEGA